MTVKITEPGIYLDFDAASYFDDPCPKPSLSQSIAKILIEQSPAHARLAHPRLAPPIAEEDEPIEKYNASQAIGNAAHASMIGRSRDIYEGEFDNWMSKDAKAAKADALEAGKIVILSKHLKRARELVKCASYQLDAAGHPLAFREGNGEVALFWQERGIWFRTLIDWMIDTTMLYDLKTSGMSCAPHAVVERPSTDGWDIQAAMHERGLNILDPDNAGRRQHHYIAVENEPPYGLTVVRISEADLTMGRKKLDYAIELWTQGITTNTWPCYPAETITSRPKGWTETKWLEREVEHDERKARQPIPSDILLAG